MTARRGSSERSLKSSRAGVITHVRALHGPPARAARTPSACGTTPNGTASGRAQAVLWERTRLGPGTTLHTDPHPTRRTLHACRHDGRRYPARNYPALTNALGSPSNNGSSLNYPANAGVFGTALSQRPTQVWKATNYLRDMVFDPD